MAKKTIVHKIVFLLFCFALSLSACFANIMPLNTEDIPDTAIGLYQTGKRITIYSKPDSASKKLVDLEIIYPNMTEQKSDNMFAIVIPQKDLGYLYVTDISDDEQWVQVIYDKGSSATGWAYKTDDFQFMSWGDFFNFYGRKYGLTRLKPENNSADIYSNPDEKAQIIERLSHPKFIRMISLEGNWVLVSIFDYSNNTTTGYVQWRDKTGKIFFFPILK